MAILVSIDLRGANRLHVLIPPWYAHIVVNVRGPFETMGERGTTLSAQHLRVKSQLILVKSVPL